jgi:hypothetical protein
MKRPPEMTKAEYRRALERNGLKQALLWISDTTGVIPDISWGVVLHGAPPRKGRMAYRATLAKALRERRVEAERRKLEHLLP